MTDDGPRLLSTYRLQLDAELTFPQAAEQLDYLARLGVTHLYLSPVLRAVPGSTHGYDVADPGEVSPALGGEEGLRALAAAAHGRGMGMIIDIVPNHVGVHHTNPLWEGLLARGPAGEEARAFDVNWDPALPGAAQKVILPVLGEQYGDALVAGHLRVGRDERGWRLHYHEHDLPLSVESAEALDRSGGAETLAGTPGEPDTWQRLHALLEGQHYRLVHWRLGHRVINYRRFFAVDTLAAVRVEDPEVFDATHAKVLELVGDGVVDGLRVDHPDGLRDPAGYLRLLRERAGDVWIVVEKILQSGEEPELLRDWPVAGTTGYEFCNDVLGLFVDPAAEQRLDALDADLGGTPAAFTAMAVRAKREILATDLASEHQRLTTDLWRLAQQHLGVRDIDDRHVAEALAATIAEMDVYRPYVDPENGRAIPEDVARVDAAVERATGSAAVPREVLDLVAAAASGRLGATVAHRDFATRFAQLSSAVMAKGVEDTVFYRYRRLLALNEVGGEPTRMGMGVEEFHRLNAARSSRHPAGMLTTSTHDTKRGEDTRLRMAAISEHVDDWASLARRWSAGAPHPQEATLVLQTLAGIWPLAGTAPDGPLRRRLHAYLEKAMREARERTSWNDVAEDFESGVAGYVDGLLDDATFVAEFGDAVHRLQETAMVAGLAQVLLRTTSPGVPDTYQGCELWEDSLVDPDNRRPVDFAARAGLLAELDDDADPAALWQARRDGRVKLWLLSRALRVRNEHPAALGTEGAYQPLDATGTMADHVVAFARTGPDGDAVVTVAPRLPGRVLRDGWGDTAVALPAGDWTDALTGMRVPNGPAALTDLLGTLPVALLVQDRA